MSGGGGAESSNAGGPYEGARKRCIGLAVLSGPAICAVGGLASPGDCAVGVLDRSGSAPIPRAAFSAFSVGTKDVGEFRRLAAPGQPHS